jgi:hypothetical protein
MGIVLDGRVGEGPDFDWECGEDVGRKVLRSIRHGIAGMGAWA